MGGRRSGPRRKACSVGVSGVCEKSLIIRQDSTFHSKTRHDFFEGDWPTAACAHSFQAFLGKIDVFQIVQILQDGFACVVGLRAAGALGQAVEALFDLVWKANGELIYKYSRSEESQALIYGGIRELGQEFSFHARGIGDTRGHTCVQDIVI